LREEHQHQPRRHQHVARVKERHSKAFPAERTVDFAKRPLDVNGGQTEQDQHRGGRRDLPELFR
jgi:hypothetical protein